MRGASILLAITVVTLIGDWCIKLASERQDGLVSPVFLIGAVLYGAPAVGWFYLMRNNSLAMIGVLYSASTILLLAVLGTFVFHESFGLRQGIGLAMAVAAVVVMR